MDWSNAFVLMFLMACVTFLIFIFISDQQHIKDSKIQRMKELNKMSTWADSGNKNYLNDQLLKLLKEF